MKRANQLSVLLGHGVADRVGNVDGGGSRFNDSFYHLAEKRGRRCASHLRAKTQRRRTGTSRKRTASRACCEALLARNAQLVFQVNVRGREKNMDARMRRALQRLPRPVHISECRRVPSRR